MKILHITQSYEGAWHLGGVVRSVSQLCRGLAALGHEVTVFTTDSGRHRRLEVPLNRPLNLGGVEVWYFKTEISLRYCFSLELWKACQQRIRDFDVVHLSAIWCFPEVAAFRELRRLERPYVVSPHGTLLKYSMSQKALKKHLYFWLLERRILEGAAALHYTALLEREGVDYLHLRAPSFVVANGLDVTEFSQIPAKEEAKRVLGLMPEHTVILYLGRLHARKGLEEGLRAFAQVAEAHPTAVLMLAGPDDGAEARLKKVSQELGLDSRVLFPGFISPDHRPMYLGAADLFFLPAREGENFGLAAVEAMLSGVPLVVSEHVGIAREVEEDQDGLVAPLTVPGLAQALDLMLSEPSRRRAMGRTAAEAARRRYNSERVSQLMAMAYEDVITGRRSPGLYWSEGNRGLPSG